MPDVILLGDINIDVSAAIPAYPSRGGEGVATSVEYHTGGSVVTTSLALANIGADVGVIGRIGNDALAQQVITDLEKIGVDKSQIQIDEVVSTGLIYIVVNPDGERTMFSSRGANVFTVPQSSWVTYFSSARWYHFSGYALMAQPQHDAAVHALELARQNYCRVSLDPNPEPAMRYGKRLRSLLPKIDVFLPNEQELMMLTGMTSFNGALATILGLGAKAVVVKRGARGCTVVHSDDRYDIPAFEIHVRDTTGAGDSFNAGVLLARTVGLDWAAAGVLGNALGAIASSVQGSGAAQVSPNAAIELIEASMFKPEWKDWHWAIEQVLAYLAETQAL